MLAVQSRPVVCGSTRVSDHAVLQVLRGFVSFAHTNPTVRSGLFVCAATEIGGCIHCTGIDGARAWYRYEPFLKRGIVGTRPVFFRKHEDIHYTSS